MNICNIVKFHEEPCSGSWDTVGRRNDGIIIIIIITRASLLYFYYVQVQRYTCDESIIPRPRASSSWTSTSRTVKSVEITLSLLVTEILMTFQILFWDIPYLGNGKRYLISDCTNEFPVPKNIGFDTSIASLALLSIQLWKKVKSQPSWIISETVWNIWILIAAMNSPCPKTYRLTPQSSLYDY